VVVSVSDGNEFSAPGVLAATSPPLLPDSFQGDIVLLSLRDFQDDKADVIAKYSPDEARELKKLGELPATAKINEIGKEEEGEGDDGEGIRR
jgi:hypothetical protein